MDYFEIDRKKVKDLSEFDYGYEYSRQKHYKFNYIEQLLQQIKPMLKLAYKLSGLTDTSEMFKKEKITEDAIVNMVDNFLMLNRTGRPRRIYPRTLERFQNFKVKYQYLFEFFRELKKPQIKSIKDYATTIMKFKITLKLLMEYKKDYNMGFKQYVDKSSKRTLYRYDKDFIFVKKSIYTVEMLENHWSTYAIVDKDYFSKN